MFPGSPLALHLALALAAAAIFVALMRARAPVWAAAGALALLANAPNLLVEDLWILSGHGLFHASMVYEIWEHGLPPENPLLAGEPLRYPWGHHALIAAAMRLVPLSPPAWFHLTNLVCLGLVVVLLDGIVRSWTRDRAARTAAVLLALAAMDPFVEPGIGALWRALGPAADHRLIPLLKFGNINNNPIGLVGLAAALLGLARIGARQGPRGGYALVCAGLLLAGWVYPVLWPAVAASVGLAAAYFALPPGPDDRPAALGLVAILALTSAAVVPVLLYLGSGQNPESRPQLLATTASYNLWNLALWWIVPGLLLATGGRRLGAAFRERREVAVVLGLSIFALQVLFLCVRGPDRTEYKFLAASALPLGALLGPLLAAWGRDRPWAALLVLVAVLVPGVGRVADRALSRETPIGAVDARRRDLVARDPSERELQAWLAANTPASAVIVDSQRGVTTQARRRLWMAIDSPWSREGLDGWYLRDAQLLAMNTGVPPRVILARRRVAMSVLWGEDERVPDAILDELARAVGGRDVYVVGRDDRARQRLAATPGLARVFETPPAALFRLERPGRAADQRR